MPSISGATVKKIYEADTTFRMTCYKNDTTFCIKIVDTKENKYVYFGSLAGQRIFDEAAREQFLQLKKEYRQQKVTNILLYPLEHFIKILPLRSKL